VSTLWPPIASDFPSGPPRNRPRGRGRLVALLLVLGGLFTPSCLPIVAQGSDPLETGPQAKAAPLLDRAPPLDGGPLLSSSRWTVEDLVRAERASDWDLAADGSLAVWLRSTVDKVEGEDRRLSRLWLSRLEAETEGADAAPSARPLTRGPDDVSAPRLAPDDRHVAFLSDRELPGTEEGGGEEKGAGAGKAAADGSEGGKPAETQLWVLPLDGGEAYPVTRFERAPKGYDWIDAETLVVAAPEAPSAWHRERRRRKDTAVVVEDAEHTPPVRLFRVDLKGAARRLTDNDDWIEALAVAPGGGRAVVTAQQSLSYEFDEKVPPETFLVDLATGERTRLELTGEGGAGEAPRRLLPFDVRWALDGSGFFFVDRYSRHPLYRAASVSRLHFYDLASGTARRVDLDWPRGLGGGYAPTSDGFVALLADGVRYRAVRYVRKGSGWRRRELTGEGPAGEHLGNLDQWELSEDGVTLVYRHSTATTPPQWYRARLDGPALTDVRRLTDLNSGWKDKPTGRVEVVRFQGARGDTVEGLLHYPLDWERETREPGSREPGARRPLRPLILDIHGGPAGTDRDTWDQRWASPGILWRQRGAFVLQVNYHGSAGYGLDWVESIEQRYYELEIPDLEAGVDHVLARGLADPERLATSGWSNGGILSAELITRTDRYRAASVGAADVEWFSDWANVDFGAAFDNYYFGGPPWEIPEVYFDKSPFFRLTEVTTPTIVYTGTEDRAVPPHQSWSLFRALQQIGEAPVRLVLFPDEPHGLRKVAHQRRKVEEDLAWFERYLFADEDEGERHGRRDETVRPGSPLAGLLARNAAVRVGERPGREVDGALVPETVPFGAAEPGLELGRFEVTRAQWAAFRGAEPPGSGADLPVTEVAFEDAQRYVAWLSELTGDSWRLPTEKEAKAFARAAGEGGNTLDRWAGYTPNPEDRERLLEALGTIGAGALLLPVGSLPGAGTPMIFDLDGNAAEWAVTADGEGVAVGPSADRSTDARSTAEPAPAYTGLRVMRRISEGTAPDREL